MKSINLFAAIFIISFFVFEFSSLAQAAEVVTQDVTLESGWNIVSTPKVLDSHTFSVDETSDNFDIYVLDAAQSTGWATMSDLGQSEFTPLYGYFINNKTGAQQTLTFNYNTTVEPNDKLFERTFSSPGWYSFGVANDEYVKPQTAERDDINNPSKLLSLMEGQYDLVIDFTDTAYDFNRKSVALSDPWKAVAPVDIDELNDFRETKGYALYVKESDARYIGFQNDATIPPPTPTTTGKLVVKTSSNNPDASLLQVEDNKKSDWYNVFTFDLDSDDSDNDISLNSIDVTVNLSSSTYSSIVDDIELIINGVTIDEVTVVNGSSSTAVLTFNIDGKAVVYSGEMAEVELMLRFKSLAAGNEGITVDAKVTSANVGAIDAESSDDVIELSGAATGDVHTLRTAGINVSPDSTNADKTSVDGATNDYGTYTVQVEVIAFEQDVYISTNPATSISYTLQDGVGNTATTGTRSVTLTSTADESGAYFEVNEGETETVTLTVTYTPGVANTAARMVLNSISFAPTAVAPTQTQTTLPAKDYQTAVITMVN